MCKVVRQGPSGDDAQHQSESDDTSLDIELPDDVMPGQFGLMFPHASDAAGGVLGNPAPQGDPPGVPLHGLDEAEHEHFPAVGEDDVVTP